MNRKDSLYKYTRLEYVNCSLNNGIYASRLQALNDPYESNGVPDSGDFRVVCLTRSRNRKLMWSHYAEGHKGCSIKIIPPSDYECDFCCLRRVKYQSVLLPKTGFSLDDYAESLYIKDKKWSDELEVRAVYYDGNKTASCWKTYRNNVYFRAVIVRVDFGCFSHFDPYYLDALIAIRDYNANHRKQIEVKKYKMSNCKYEFIYDNTFDYVKEILKITGGGVDYANK